VLKQEEKERGVMATTMIKWRYDDHMIRKERMDAIRNIIAIIRLLI
jgi:hypothetical protein